MSVSLRSELGPITAGGAAGDIVAYLENANTNRLTAAGSHNPTAPTVIAATSPGRYYADDSEHAGQVARDTR